MSLEEQWEKEGGAISSKYKKESRTALEEAYARQIARMQGRMAGTGYSEAMGIAAQSQAGSEIADVGTGAEIAEAKMKSAFYERERTQKQILEMEALRHAHRMDALELTAELNDPAWYQQMGDIVGGLIGILGQTGLFSNVPVPEIAQPNITPSMIPKGW